MRAIKTTTISILAVGLLAGSAVGVTAQDETSTEPAEVTGRAIFIEGEVVAPTFAELDGVFVGDGLVVAHTWETSDPRLNGTAYRSVNFRFDTDFRNGIESEAMVLTNDGGSWVGDGWGYNAAGDGSGFVALQGRDGYDGLTAFIAHGPNTGTYWELEGLIFPVERPEFPEPYVAE